MDLDDGMASRLTSKSFLDVMIRFSAIAVLTLMCFRIFEPFINFLLWGLVLAVMIYPLHQRLAKRFGGKQGRSAIVIVIVGILLLDVPLGLLGTSLVTHVKDIRTAYESNTLVIPEPGPKVAEWPVIGKKLYKAWNMAHTNLSEFLTDYRDKIQKLGQHAITFAENTVGSILLFYGALIIAGIMMAWGQPGSNAMMGILKRVAGPVQGPQLHKLSVATIRSVATGVLGVAFIQGLLFGIGFLVAGIPAAGLLGLIIIFIAIIQLPTAIVAVPVVIYLWSAGDASITANLAYTAYFVFAGVSDNMLKPLLLGRGVDAPMPVILIGALGGMIARGFIGLFLGAILLAIGYQIFMNWVDDDNDQTADGSKPAVSAGNVSPET